MRKFFGLAVLIFVGTVAWRVGNALSPDALAMAVGVLFGVMAGVPTALLVMAGGRQREAAEPAARPRQSAPAHAGLPYRDHGAMQPGTWGQPSPAYASPYGQQPYSQPYPQPPVIVLAGPQGMGLGNPGPSYPNYGTNYGNSHGQPALPPPQARRFKMVGEREEWVEDW